MTGTDSVVPYHVRRALELAVLHRERLAAVAQLNLGDQVRQHPDVPNPIRIDLLGTIEKVEVDHRHGLSTIRHTPSCYRISTVLYGVAWRTPGGSIVLRSWERRRNLALVPVL